MRSARYLHEIERLSEEAENEVGRGEVQYQQVARSAHARVGDHHVADETIAGRAERNQCREQHDQRHLASVETVASYITPSLAIDALQAKFHYAVQLTSRSQTS